MNIDAKTVNKMLVNLIWQHLQKTIQYDQVGFILGVQGWLTICKLISIMEHIIKTTDKNHMTLTINAKKGFNKFNNLS
jgi:hypothetical protein